MKKITPVLCVLFLAIALSSCSVATGIFKAGVWVGILVVVLIIAVVIFLVTRGANKN